MPVGLNLRYELRAYENTDACRLASIVKDMDGEAVDRADIAARWAQRYPRHAEQTGNRRIGRRIGRALDLLRVAGILRHTADTVVIVDRVRLAVAASNLEIVEDASGVAIPPSEWPLRPEVPQHLVEVQAPIEVERLKAAAARSAAMSDAEWFEWTWAKRRVFTEMPEKPWRFSPGDRVRVDFQTSAERPEAAWYRAVVIGPSTQRAGDFFVRVTEASQNSGVAPGARLSPILYGAVDLVPDPA